MSFSVDQVSPFFRGLTFDGEKGLIIHFQEKSQVSNDFFQTLCDSNPNHIPPLYLKNEDRNGDLIDYLKEMFQQYKDAHGKSPAVILLEGSGILSLGTDYDEAVERNKMVADNKLPDISDEVIETEPEPKKILDRSWLLQNKISVVTGSAQGFGESITRHLVEAGSLVFIADINLEGAREVANELNKEYNRTVALPVGVDVTDNESVAEMVQSVVKQVGGIDLFVSNAGVLRAGSVIEMEADTFRFVTDVNYIGYFLCTKHASPVMALQYEANHNYFSDIIQINSKSGLEGSNKNSAYAGGKFGGIGLTQSFAKELVEYNIKVNSICPGNFFEGPLWSDPDNGLFVQYLNTGKVPGAETIEDVKRHYESQVPMGRGCRGEDVVRAIFYILDQKYETGQAVPVTGGQIMLK